MHDTQQLADEVCRYDLDFLDVQWLDATNDLMDDMGKDSEVLMCKHFNKVVKNLNAMGYTCSILKDTSPLHKDLCLVTQFHIHTSNFISMARMLE